MPYLYPPTPEQERLLAIMYDNPDVPREPKKKVLQRAEAGRALAALGDPRPEVMTLDGMHFCSIPAGVFQLGSDGDKLAYKYEKPATLYDIPYAYWMARFPVTQAQFQIFVDDNGYRDERWWGVAQAAGCWSEAGYRYQSLGRYNDYCDDPAPRFAPIPYREPFSLPNHPVVGVSWYEGVAFAEWLTGRWRAQGFLTKAQQVVVPSEPEWEKAARGGILVPQTPLIHTAHDGFSATAPALNQNLRGGLYPYGNLAVPFKSSYYKTDLQTSNAVGIFSVGRSVYGCEEMSGGVWEWTRSGSSHLIGGDPYPYHPDCEFSAPAYPFRVTRGGSWASNYRGVRCAARNSEPPSDRNDRQGLRLAVV